MDERVIKFRVGVTVLSTILVGAILVLLFGDTGSIAGGTYTIYMQFDDAPGVTERVRTEIGRRVQAVPVTVSAGVATMPDNALDGDRLVSAADAALYEAKRDGRDRAMASTRAAGATAPAVVRLNDAPLARGA